MTDFRIDGDVVAVDVFGYDNDRHGNHSYLDAMQRGVLSRTLGITEVRFMGVTCDCVVEAVGTDDQGRINEIKPVMLMLNEKMLPYLELNGRQLCGIEGEQVKQ